MAKAIFYHKAGSIYDDAPGRYHFPKTYLSRVSQAVGDWIIYYGPLPGLKSRYYSGMARINHVSPDPLRAGHFYALLDDYLDFDRPVDYVERGGFEKQLVRPDGTINPGRSVQAVRIIDDREFAAIVQAGLSEPDEWPARTDAQAIDLPRLELDETAQTPFLFEPIERTILQQTINRPFRDAKFKQHIRQVYDRTRAFTGLRLINGGGRPEVEAAHIVPVERGGNDSIQNGLALSGTVHWMFDRGLLSIADDYKILQSRHLNEDISHMLARDLIAKVPAEPRHRPHPVYMAWHRDNIFKQ